MNKHVEKKHELTKNQALVMGALSNSCGPLSAYTILDQLRQNGLRAPLQVYRALDKLIEIGLVHRLESLNAFIACSHPGCDDHGTIAFAICETCGATAEIADDDLSSKLRQVAKQSGFKASNSIVELRGQCRDCR